MAGKIEMRVDWQPTQSGWALVNKWRRAADRGLIGPVSWKRNPA